MQGQRVARQSETALYQLLQGAGISGRAEVAGRIGRLAQAPPAKTVVKLKPKRRTSRS